MQCCLKPLGQYCMGFLPVQCCSKSINRTLNIAQDLIFYKVVWRILDKIAQGFHLSNIAPRVLRKHCTEFFLLQSCLGLLEQNCIGFLPAQFCPKSIKRTLRRIFSNTKLSDAIRQHCIGPSAAQCCPKSIKTTLHMIFSYSMLYGAFLTTLHRVLICTMLF